MVPLYLRIISVAAAILVFATPAFADNEERAYFSFTGTLNIAEDLSLGEQDSRLNNVLTASDAEIQMDTGLGFTHAVGYKFSSGIRAELEFSFRELDMDKGVSKTVGNTKVVGDLNTKSLLANVAYEFDIDWPINPYIGYGMGIAWHELDLEKTGGTLSELEKGDSTTFAYQFFLGINMPVFDEAEVLMGYRYFGTTDPDLEIFTTELSIHAFEIGLRYFF